MLSPPNGERDLQMALCALILAHHRPALLARLVTRLHQGGIDCYIHIDAKQDDAPFRAAVGSRARFVTPRVPIYWGGFSMIEAVFHLAEAAMAHGDYTQFLHISGDTYPIKPLPAIETMLSAGGDWIDTGPVTEDDPLFRRIRETYVPDCPLGNLSSRDWYGLRSVDATLLRQIDAIKRIAEIKNGTALPVRYAKGSNWWCLRHDSLQTCQHHYRHNPDLVDWFRYSAHPDESFFNSMVLNFVPDSNRRGSPVFAVWDRQPQPFEFTQREELPLLQTAGQPFARKFGESADSLLDALDAV